MYHRWSRCYSYIGKVRLTNASRRIRNAWHFYYALILVNKVVCRSTVLRCSPLKRALCVMRILCKNS
ncbi:TPA: DUF3265 domain-containing protein [Vibrio vulnificus]|nr:DUF3265 domain-containing protein [Vibrio vulnificus]HAS6107072.1 DUF3265 domain-containing protein [Vibrio vulnificus]HDY7933550.1 DUF3265 domain-containing protein [Vibrio vulnificus]HDY7988254.1 DUF3265 domain-containing protein [Vibrio vulnificus]